jgi:hypothetical protein
MLLHAGMPVAACMHAVAAAALGPACCCLSPSACAACCLLLPVACCLLLPVTCPPACQAARLPVPLFSLYLP